MVRRRYYSVPLLLGLAMTMFCDLISMFLCRNSISIYFCNWCGFLTFAMKEFILLVLWTILVLFQSIPFYCHTVTLAGGLQYF